MNAQSFTSSIDERRHALSRTIVSMLNLRLKRLGASRSVDAVIYGKKFERHDIFGTDYDNNSDTFGLMMPISGHMCDIVFVLRYCDIRIGLMLPNPVIEDIENADMDALSVVAGTDRGGRQLTDLLKAGFYAYPAQGGSYPFVSWRRHNHGVYMEYCFGGSFADMCSAALYGNVPCEAAADVLVHAALHILQAVSSIAYACSVRGHAACGKGERIEFEHHNTSAELIRNYCLEPAHLEIIREATTSQPGHYVLNFLEHERARIETLLLEIEDRSKVEQAD